MVFAFATVIDGPIGHRRKRVGDLPVTSLLPNTVYVICLVYVQCTLLYFAWLPSTIIGARGCGAAATINRLNSQNSGATARKKNCRITLVRPYLCRFGQFEYCSCSAPYTFNKVDNHDIRLHTTKHFRLSCYYY